MLDLSTATRALSPAQIRSIAEAGSPDCRIALWSGAIRSGKTFASLLAWLIFVAVAPRRGQLVMIGRTKDTIYRNLITQLQDSTLFGPLAAIVHYTPGASTCTIFGRTVHLIGAHDVKAEKVLRGLTCAGAYVDEATVIPQEFWVQLIGRMSVKGARIFATTNPDNPSHWLRRDFILRAGEAAIRLRHWHFTMDDNPSLSREYVEATKASFTGLWYRRFILGAWVAAEGAVFDQWDDTVMVVPDGQLPTMHRWLSCGIDYGNTNPFAALLLGLGTDRKLYVASEWRWNSKQTHRQLSDSQYSERVRDWLSNIPIPGTSPILRGVRPQWTCVDPSASSFITQLHRDGLTPTPANNSVLDGIRNMSTLMSRDVFRVAASCKGLIEEIPGYSWDDDESKKGRDVPIKTADHSIDGCRYGIHTTEALWRPYLLENR